MDRKNRPRNGKKAGAGGASAGKGIRYLKERGLKEFSAHAVEKARDSRFDYGKWIRKERISSVQAGYQKKLALSRMPAIYVIIAKEPKNFGEGGDVPEGPAGDLMEATLLSIRESTYSKVYPVQALNTQIRDEDFLSFVREGDLIEKNAFFEMAKALQDGADAVYSDSDSWMETDKGIAYLDPLFKPEFDPDFLRSGNYIGRLFLVRAGIVRSLCRAKEWENGLFSGRIPTAERLADPAYCWWLTLGAADIASSEGGVRRVPKVLCHIRKENGPDMDDDAKERSKKVLEEDLARRGYKGIIEEGPLPGTFHVAYAIEGEPLVSIVIPNADHASVLENCIQSIQRRSTWKNLEIVVVENNSVRPETFALYRELQKAEKARIVRYPHAFHFSKVINEGVRRAKGEYVVLMNNDVTVRTPDWIEKLLAHVMRPGVGACGPKLLYPDGRVQSAGIVTGIMGFAGSMMVAERGDDPGYMGRAVLTQDLSAVTAACMMVQRKAFLKAGGFPDEFTVALGDVDFCLSLRDAGYRIVFEPAAVMIHHESLTRGAEDSKEKKKRFRAEKERFRKKRVKILKEGDPAYNPNLSRRRCDWSQQT